MTDPMDSVPHPVLGDPFTAAFAYAVALLYVGATRARAHLVVIASDALGGLLG